MLLYIYAKRFPCEGVLPTCTTVKNLIDIYVIADKYSLKELAESAEEALEMSLVSVGYPNTSNFAVGKDLLPLFVECVFGDKKLLIRRKHYMASWVFEVFSAEHDANGKHVQVESWTEEYPELTRLVLLHCATTIEMSPLIPAGRDDSGETGYDDTIDALEPESGW